MPETIPYHLWETLLYDLLRTLPHMILVLYAFRGHWRFSKKVTIPLTAVVWLIEMTIPQIYRFLLRQSSPFFNILEVSIYIIFIFAEIKEHIGKLVFTVLALSNLGNIMSVGGKCLEGIFFPEEALLEYHFTRFFFSLPLLAAELTLAYLLVFRDICDHGDPSDEPADTKKIGGYMWRYLWIVPAVFSVIWYQNLNASGHPSLEYKLNPFNFMYLLVITAGSLLIYRIIVQIVALYEKNTALLTENHTLSIQRLQYDSLNERLENMRRTRHDIRHHTALLKEIRDKGDISALDDLISMYTEENRLDHPLICCENETVNIVLALYSETAHQNGIALSVKANVPNDIFADKKDLVVLFGNILENASDACKEVETERFIDLTAAYSVTPSGQHCFSLIVKNSCTENISCDEKGIFKSTKHAGDGIGINSVRNITEKYGGACSITHADGVFTVSVILYG